MIPGSAGGHSRGRWVLGGAGWRGLRVVRQCWGRHRAGRSQPDPCGEEGQGREWLRCQRTLLLLGEWEAEPGNGGQDVLGALVSLESPGVLQAALSQPCAPVTPVSWCSLHSSAQQPLLQVHLTWFWENLASEMVPHFPSPHPRPLLWVQGGNQWVMAVVVPLPGLGWSRLPGHWLCRWGNGGRSSWVSLARCLLWEPPVPELRGSSADGPLGRAPVPVLCSPLPFKGSFQ